MVFYTLGEDGKADISSFYSEYAFAGMEQYYVRCADGTVASLSVVSSDPVVIAQSLGIGKTLCWAWFEEFFTDAAATAQASGSAVEAYNEYCKEICVSEYAFAPELAAILNDALALAFVTGTEGDSLVVNTYSPTEEKRVENGLVTFGADVCHVYSYGMFVRPSSAADLMEGSAVWLLVPETEGTSDATDVALTAAGITYEKGGLYTVDGTIDNASNAVPDEAGNRRLYKIYPSLTDTSRAQISVTISATVTV